VLSCLPGTTKTGTVVIFKISIKSKLSVKMSTNYVPRLQDKDISFVKLVGNQQDEDIQTGRSKPPLFTVESPQSIQLVIDGKHSLGGNNPFSFRATINNNLFRSRLMRVSKVVIPKPPNITPFNNTIKFVSDTGPIFVHTVTLQSAFYNTTTLANEIAKKMTEGSNADDIYTAEFDPITRTFQVSLTRLGVPRKFFFVDTCSFITRGIFLAPFESFPELSNPVAVGKTSWNSGVAGMLYTRYAIVSSESLNQYAFSDSRTTTLMLKNNILCVLDLTSIYTPEDYDVGVPFSGVYASITTPDAPHIMVTNPQRNMNDKVDITVQDEYGEDFNACMDMGVDYHTNTLGISIWMEVSF
jgi:hypothetical protein